MALSTASIAVSASPLKGTVFERAAQKVDLDPALLYAVALQESSKSNGYGSVKPDHLVLRAPSYIYRADSKEDACVNLKSYENRFKKVVDVGMMQVNVKYNGHRVQDSCDLLDVETNAMVGAKILKESIDSHPKNLAMGVGKYHNGNPHIAIPYGERVLKIYERLKLHGF